MGFDYSGFVAISIRQINDKGRSVSYIYETQGTYDPQTDTFSGKTTKTDIVKMLLTDFKQTDKADTVIEDVDKMWLLAPDNLERAPVSGDTVEDGEERYTVTSVETVRPGDTALLYKLRMGR